MRPADAVDLVLVDGIGEWQGTLPGLNFCALATHSRRMQRGGRESVDTARCVACVVAL